MTITNNILIQLYMMLENTQEFKDEKTSEDSHKRAKDEPVDRKCLENMRARYGENNQG